MASGRRRVRPPRHPREQRRDRPRPHPGEDDAEADFDAVLAVHLKGSFNCAHHAAVVMKRSRVRAHHQHHVVRRAAGQLRPDQLRRGEGRAHGAHVHLGARARPVAAITVNAVAPAGATRMTAALFERSGERATARAGPGAQRAARRVPRVGTGRARERPDPGPHRLRVHDLPAPQADRVHVARRRLDPRAGRRALRPGARPAPPDRRHGDALRDGVLRADA